MPEHRRRDQAPPPPLRVAAVPPPPVTPDLHITLARFALVPGRFPLADGDRHRWNLTGISRPLYPDEQGPNCDALNLPEGLAARFQSLPSFQISKFQKCVEICRKIKKLSNQFFCTLEVELDYFCY
jgi:hypothetical protein